MCVHVSVSVCVSCVCVCDSVACAFVSECVSLLHVFLCLDVCLSVCMNLLRHQTCHFIGP